MVDLHEKGLIRKLLDVQALTAMLRNRWPVTPITSKSAQPVR